MKCIKLLLYTLLLYIPAVAQWHGFDTIVSYSLQETANLIHTKDITGDGVSDMTAFYSASYPAFDILTGSKEGKFSSPRNMSKEDNYFLSDIGNLNGDGYPDLVISSYWNNGLKIFFGKASGQFSEGVFVPTGVHGRAIKCVDINKDGLTDIVATTSGSGQTISLHVFIGKGDGSFQPKKTFTSVLDTSKDIIITDKNGDGLLDVIVTSSFPWIVMFVQNEAGDFGTHYFPTHQPARIAFTDINKDNLDDMVLLYSSFDNTPGSDSLLTRLNTGGVDFSESTRIGAFQKKSIRPYHLQTVDLNRDGFKDLVFNHTDIEGYSTDTVYYMLGKSGTEFHNPAYFTLPAKLVTMQFADLDGNGYSDLIASCDDKKVYIGFNGEQKQNDEKHVFRVYPNPARGSFTIESPVAAPFTIQINNISRQVVYQQQQTGSKVVVTQKFSRGLYYITIIKGSLKTTRPLLIL